MQLKKNSMVNKTTNIKDEELERSNVWAYDILFLFDEECGLKFTVSVHEPGS
jgi:hypothetical protein